MTKKLNHVFNDLISIENLRLAAQKAMKGKKKFKEVQYFINHEDELLLELHEQLKNNTWVPSQYRTKIIFEPKKRTIYILPFYPDRIVHHAIMNFLEPFYVKRFIDKSYACIKGKGIHVASNYTRDQVDKYNYCLKCDISKFYLNVDHHILMQILSHKIKDKSLLNLLWKIIDTTDGNNNIPIGNYLSQWFGNIYLNELDKYIKMDLKFKSYLRYCDDFALFSNDKKELADIRSKLEFFIHDKLHLRFSKSEIFHVKNGVDFLGFRHFKGFKLLRKRISVKIKRELRNIRNNLEKSILYERFLSTIDSYMGWLKWCNSFNFITKYDILNLRQVLTMYENIPSFSQLWESTKKGFLIGETIGIEKVFDKGIIVTDVAFRTVKSKKTSDNEETCVIQFSYLDDIDKTKHVTFTRSKKIIGKIKDVYNPDSDFICFKCKIVKEENGTFDIL